MSTRLHRTAAGSTAAVLCALAGFAAGCAAGPRSARAAAPPPLHSAPDPDPDPVSARSGARAAPVGEPAPDVVLFDVVAGAPFALGERLGRTQVLYFFPRADTPDCACDATAFTEDLWRFGTLGVDIACVTSASEADAARYARKYGLIAPLLVDPSLEVARAFGALDPSRADPVVRTSVVIGPEGRVQARFDDVQGSGHVDELLRFLDASDAR